MGITDLLITVMRTFEVCARHVMLDAQDNRVRQRCMRSDREDYVQRTVVIQE